MLNTKKLLIGSAFAGVFAVAGASSAWAAPANTAFTDDNFYKCVVDAYNTTNSTSVPVTTNLTDAQLQTITSMSCISASISNVTGVEKLSRLESLVLTNNSITSIDLTNIPALNTVILDNNALTSVTFPSGTALKTVSVSNNQLTTLDLAKYINLTGLYASNNKIASINLVKNDQLETLDLSSNLLTGINIAANAKLQYLSLSSNQLTALDISNNKKLKTLIVQGNKLTALNIANITSADGSTTLGYFTADDITVTTSIQAVYEEGKYTASLGGLAKAIGLIDGYATIADTDSYSWTKSGCAYDQGCIIINDVSKYPGYVQTKTVDTMTGNFAGNKTFKLVITPYREETNANTDTNANTNTDNSSSTSTATNKSGVGTPDTGVFGGMANGALIAIPATIVAIVAAAWFTIRYGAKRISGRVKFDKGDK